VIKLTAFVLAAASVVAVAVSTGNGEDNMGYRELTAEEEAVIVHGGTEMPFTGEFTDTFDKGIYTCRRCGAPLYVSETKFRAHCGWPAFDSAVPGAVEQLADPDGTRTEIRCASCGGHLGHVFTGEGYTETDTRHCVNSISMDFIPGGSIETAYFAGGCFWGIEHTFDHTDGVLDAASGYMGGTSSEPEYREVCSGTTGHAEAVRVLFNSEAVSYRELARIFFEIHDPTQVNRQGVDTGTQYRSAVFYTSEEQLQVINELTGILRDQGYRIATEVSPAGTFYPAEDYHQNYFDANGVRGSCHVRVSRFPD